MMRFSLRVRSRLISSNWFEGRDIGIEDYQNLFAAQGVSLSPPAARFLREFRGISVPRLDDSASLRRLKAAALVVEPGLAIRSTKSPDVLERLGAASPLGAVNGCQEDLIMDSIGRVYAVVDDFVNLMGDSGDAALENILGRD